MGIDMAEVKKYNQRVNEAKQKVAQSRAEIEVSRREMERLCKELSVELGIDVNEDNIEKIYAEHISKIKAQIEEGERILNRADDSQQETIKDTVASSGAGMFNEAGVVNGNQLGTSFGTLTLNQPVNQGQQGMNQQGMNQQGMNQQGMNQQFNSQVNNQYTSNQNSMAQQNTVQSTVNTSNQVHMPSRASFLQNVGSGLKGFPLQEKEPEIPDFVKGTFSI